MVGLFLLIGSEGGESHSVSVEGLVRLSAVSCVGEV